MNRTKLLAAALTLGWAAPLLAQTTLNVRDADIRAFIADAAKATGRTFIVDGRVQGKVTVVTDRPLSRSEYFEVFLSTLRANGLVAVPSANGAFRIQPIDNAAQAPSRVGLGGAGRNALVTEIIRLRAVDAQSVLDTVRPLVSAQGSVSANRAANSIVVVDFADNVRRVREVIRRVDTDSASTRVIALKSAGAREVATALQALNGAQGSGAQAAETIAITAVPGSNSVLLRGDPAAVARLAAVAEELDRKGGNGQDIRVVFLENADAEQLLPVLQQLVGETPTQPTSAPTAITPFGSSSTTTGTNSNVNGQSVPQSAPAPAGGGGAGGGGAPANAAITTEGGRTAAVVTRFAGANAIVIAAPAEVQRQLAEVIRQLDTRREQVQIEAVVAEVSDQTARTLGGQFIVGNPNGGVLGGSSFTDSAPNILQIAGAIGARSLGASTTTVSNGVVVTGQDTTISDQLAQSAITSILGSNGGFGGFGGKIGSTFLGAIISAVKSDTQSNLLQTPSIVTLDNTEAKLLVGEEIPITTGQALSQNFDNQFRTTQRENVGIQLEVKPQINSSGSIKLFIHQQVSSIAGTVSATNGDYVLNKREVQTTRTVDDGQIAVIAGLLDDNERRVVEKTPVLGDIPVLGTLFKQKSRSRTKTNLMIFIRPTILRTPEDSRKLTEQRYGYLRVQESILDPDREPSIDELVRDYMGAAPPIPPAPLPGSIEDPRVGVAPVKPPVRKGKR